MIFEYNVTELSSGFVRIEAPENSTEEERIQIARKEIENGNAVYGTSEVKIGECIYKNEK